MAENSNNVNETKNVIELLENTEIVDLSDTDKNQEAPKPEALPGYGSGAYRQKEASARGVRDVLLLSVLGVMGIVKVAVVIFVIWFFSARFSVTMDAMEDMGKTASSGIIGFYGKVISPELEQKLEAIKARIDMYFLFDQSEADFETGILKGYVDSLGDPYTVYYSPEEYKDLMESTSGKYSGIGVVVQQNPNGFITVVRPYLDGPGYTAGIRTDDIIYKVSGEEVTGQDLSLVVSKIKGDAGTTVDIQIYRPSTGEYIDMTVERAELEIETITSEMLDDHIGKITMTSFDEVTYDQFMKAYRSLKEQGMQALIVDIRDNGGGLLNSVTDILDDLLPAGVLTYTEDRDGNREYYRSGASASLDVPAVVLVNGYSASASEIFTGVMKEYGAATIVGTKTLGKGIVQVILALGDGSALKVTSSRYFLPSGICIHGEGVEPDVVIEADPESEVDEQLNKAIEILLEKITE